MSRRSTALFMTGITSRLLVSFNTFSSSGCRAGETRTSTEGFLYILYDVIAPFARSCACHRTDLLTIYLRGLGKGKLAKRRSRSGASRRKANTAREHAQVPTAVIETSDTEESSTKPSDEIRHSSSHDITADQRTSPKQHGKPRLSEVSTGATRTQSPLRPVITVLLFLHFHWETARRRLTHK